MPVRATTKQLWIFTRTERTIPTSTIAAIFMEGTTAKCLKMTNHIHSHCQQKAVKQNLGVNAFAINA
jgi:hypothetical protein